ncbi:uncharacterized protein [Drosophila tropicalis]|uniref:uncharacterized protein n=1 Tax=Drosophila tropicalis TaxID=46794 RepID=UPI0035ABF7CC
MAEAAEQAPSKIPDWVKANLFEDVLKSTVKGYKKVKSFKPVIGSAAGENYATIMLRLEIEVELEDGKIKPISYMLKLPHQTEVFQKMMETTNIFDIERNAYQKIVPELEELYKNNGVDIKFGAQSYDLKNAKTDYVLLEDLRPQGFKNANRLEGLDQQHTDKVLRKLSQWHAASIVRVATKGPYEESLTTGFFKEENRQMMTEMNKALSQIFLKCCATYEGNETYFEDVKVLQPKVTDEIFKMAKLDPLELNVLNHGDCWSNNIMFQYDAFGKIKEVYLVDYQMPRWGTVAQDLLYFLISSTKLEDKLSKFDQNIKFYHDNLVEHLKLLKYSKPLPTLRDIHLSLFKYGFWGYCTATGVMAAVLLDPTESASFENFLGDTEEGTDFRTLMYSNARYRKHIQAILPWLHNRGALETS